MTFVRLESNNNIATWQQFRSITRKSNCRLLHRLDDFPNSILISGCQRSGTTMLSRMIRDSNEIVDHSFGKDDELDAALILSGLYEYKPRGRYCFQTTYVDQKYKEYLEHIGSFKMIWVLRNPYSTIYSLVYNWPSVYLDQTFNDGVIPMLNGWDRFRYHFMGRRVFNRIRRACYLYNWKLEHLFKLYPKLGPGYLMVVDYDELVVEKNKILSAIYRFVDLNFYEYYADPVHDKSLDKRHHLTESEIRTIESSCEGAFMKAKNFLRETNGVKL